MKLSIITINRNNAAGLRKTIESVVSQTFTDFEYIIIDGASTDGSVEIIKEFAEKITYWVSEPDKGIYNAMNKGILKAKGEYLLFLNSGDFLYNKFVISKFVNYRYKDDIIFGDLIIYDEYLKSKIKKYHRLMVYDIITNSLPHQASFIKKDLFERTGMYNENFKIVSDWKFFVDAIIINNCTIKHIQEFISYFNANGIGSSNLDLDNIERIQVLNKLADQMILQDYNTEKLVDITRFFTITENMIYILFFILIHRYSMLKKEKIKYKNLPKRIQSDYIYHFKVKSILSIPYYRSFYYLVRRIAEYIIKKRQISIYY